MRVVCAWCHSQLEQGSEPASHGICPSCFDRLKAAVAAKSVTAADAVDEIPTVIAQEEVHPNA
jgi:hypothetical protein